jgi:hypothetical protein
MYWRNNKTSSKKPTWEVLVYDKENCEEYNKKLKVWKQHKKLFQENNKVQFMDEQFKPSEENLCPKTNEMSSIQWLRPWSSNERDGTINGSYERWRVNRDPISSSSYQGNLGDCWFLSGLFDFKF